MVANLIYIHNAPKSIYNFIEFLETVYMEYYYLVMRVFLGFIVSGINFPTNVYKLNAIYSVRYLDITKRKRVFPSV